MSIKDKPLLVHFGGLCNPLTREETRVADFDTRFASIGRFLVREVLKLHRRLSPEGRSSYDTEDLFIEIWIELSKRNRKYDHTRGNYRTFAMRVMRNKFSEILKTCRVVRLPSDADKTFRSSDPAKVARLSRTATDHEPLRRCLVQDRQPSPIDGLIWLEESEKAVADVAEHIGNMSPHEAIAVRVLGLWGRQRTVSEVAREYGLRPGVVRRALESAKAKLESE